MKLSFPGMFLTSFGILLIVFRSLISRLAVEWNYRLLGIRTGERGYRISFLCVGALFIAVGILTLLRWIEFR